MTIIQKVLRRLVIGAAVAWVVLFTVECRDCGATRYTWRPGCGCRTPK